MTPSSIIQNLLAEIEQLDREATLKKSPDFSYGEYVKARRAQYAHYRTAAPKMAKALARCLVLLQDANEYQVNISRVYSEIARILSDEPTNEGEK